jgi:hypothetical protein
MLRSAGVAAAVGFVIGQASAQEVCPFRVGSDYQGFSAECLADLVSYVDDPLNASVYVTTSSIVELQTIDGHDLDLVFSATKKRDGGDVVLDVMVFIRGEDWTFPGQLNIGSPLQEIRLFKTKADVTCQRTCQTEEYYNGLISKDFLRVMLAGPEESPFRIIGSGAVLDGELRRAEIAAFVKQAASFGVFSLD